VPKPLAAVPDLEKELDELYGLPPAEFTAARNDLARRLKQAGQDEPAETVKSLRKPTVPLWAVNQLARRRPKQIQALIEAGEQLRKAQEQALRGGESSALRDATAAERALLRELTQQGDDLLRETGHGSAGERIASTLRSAAHDPKGSALLAQGRLNEELQSPGFGAFAGMEIPRATPKAKQPTPAAARRREERLTKLRDRAAKLRKMERQAAKEVTQAEAVLERARTKAAQAEEVAARAEVELEDAEVE
jgi:hypothetical protein